MNQPVEHSTLESHKVVLSSHQHTITHQLDQSLVVLPLKQLFSADSIGGTFVAVHTPSPSSQIQIQSPPEGTRS